jgi:hypothetical protein
MSSNSTNSNAPLTSDQLMKIMEGCDYPHRLADILRRAFEKKKNHVHITGTNSLISISYLLSNTLYNNINHLSNLVVVDSLEQADQLAKQLRFFRPDFSVHILPSFDVSPYSGLYPSPATSWLRCDFLYWASHNDSLKFNKRNTSSSPPLPGCYKRLRRILIFTSVANYLKPDKSFRKSLRPISILWVINRPL